VRVLIDYRPALRERTGVGQYTHQLIGALTDAYANRGTAPLDLTVFSSSWKDRLRAPSELGRVTVVDRSVPVSVLNFLWHRLGWPPVELLVNDRREYDVTHSSHPLILPARRAAHVVTIHDLNFLKHPERTRAEIRRDYPSFARAHAQRADCILVSSSFAAGDVVRELNVPRERIAVCPPGAPDWHPVSREDREGYILFVGTLEPRKNLGGLLDAYELLAVGGGEAVRGNVPSLVIAGSAPDAARVWLDRLGHAPLKGKVRHIGYVDSSDMERLYQHARLVVVPSFEEGFGFPVLEAMTVGVPVVAARRGSLPEVLGDAGPLVDPDRPAEIAAAMRRVLTDDDYAAECVERGLARARAYRWETTARTVYEAYRQAMEHHARRR
jgi:glycosyltransferase involved in cell wall biosynthesis